MNPQNYVAQIRRIKQTNINAESTWQEMTPGGTIYDAANSEEFKTVDQLLEKGRNFRKILC